MAKVPTGVVVEETRGRKKHPRTIEHNGLFKDQNARLRSIATTEGVDVAVVVRRVIDWYLDAKEAQEAKYAQVTEFEKLPKVDSKKTKNK